MSITYISIDVAVRSLAIGVYRMKSFRNIDSYKNDNPIVMNATLNSIITPIVMKVIDINSGTKTKDTSITTKAIALKSTLTEFDACIHDTIDHATTRVLIEYQMNANHGSNAIFNMILYHYAGQYPIDIMKPSLKNTIALHPLLSISTFLGYCSTNYKANKEHTKYNMLYLLNTIDSMDMIKDIAKKNHDDIADTLCQALAFHRLQ